LLSILLPPKRSCCSTPQSFIPAASAQSAFLCM
jgi:hypothetical protein